MGTHPYGRLGGTKAYRGDIIVHSDEYFKMLSQLRVKNGENAPVRDGLGILHFLQSDYAPIFTAILSL